MTPSYKLADGVLLVDDAPLYRILNIQTQRSIVADFRHIPFLKSLAYGKPIREGAHLVEPLMELGLIALGSPGVDPLIEKAIRRVEPPHPSSQANLYNQLVERYSGQKHHPVTRFERKSNPANNLRRILQIHRHLQERPSVIGCFGDNLDEGLRHLGHSVQKLDAPWTNPTQANLDAVVIGSIPSPKTLVPVLRGLLQVTPTGKPIFMPLASELATPFLQLGETLPIQILEWHSQALTYCNPYTGHIESTGDLLTLEKNRDLTRSDLDNPAQFKMPALRAPANNDKSYIGIFREIENTRYARPMYLDILLDSLKDHFQLDFTTTKYLAQDWTYISCESDHGSLRLNSNRRSATVRVEMAPYHQEIELSLRQLLLGAFDLDLSRGTLIENPSHWLLDTSPATGDLLFDPQKNEPST